VSGFVALVLLTTSCAATGDAGDDRLEVVAAFYPLQEAAQRIGGDRVEVGNLTPPGVEPHDLELAPDDLVSITSADVVLFLGGGFQPAVEDAVEQATGRTVDVAQGLATLPAPPEDEEGHTEESNATEDASHLDSHVWLDPGSYGEIVSSVAEAMAAAAPEAASSFRANAEAFRRELAALDMRFERGLEDCRRRIIVVNHAAFGYLAEAYRLDQVPISGLSPEAEPDPRRLAELSRFVRDNDVTTIFTEELVSPEVAEVLADEAGVSTGVLYTLEGLTDEQITAGDDYVAVMDRNLETLRDALECA
jgi:zinc transport system substrate-binding protein